METNKTIANEPKRDTKNSNVLRINSRKWNLEFPDSSIVEIDFSFNIKGNIVAIRKYLLSLNSKELDLKNVLSTIISILDFPKKEQNEKSISVKYYYINDFFGRICDSINWSHGEYIDYSLSKLSQDIPILITSLKDGDIYSLQFSGSRKQIENLNIIL